MSGEKDIISLIKNMTPKLKEGEYVFCTVTSLSNMDISDILGLFKEDEGITIILKKQSADRLNLSYNYIAAWITLTIHSSLEAVGFTAAFSSALAQHLISSNVIAAYYHDHIFVAQSDAEKAMRVLRQLSSK